MRGSEPTPSSKARWDILSYRHPSRLTNLLALLMLSIVLALPGCGTKASAPKSVHVGGVVAAAPDVNPSVNDRPSPLLLRIYELRARTTFDQADFMSLYQADQATLATDLVGREEFMLQPGEKRPYAKDLSPETRFVGVVAVYRNLEKATWRAVVPVSNKGPLRLDVVAARLALSATISR